MRGKPFNGKMDEAKLRRFAALALANRYMVLYGYTCQGYPGRPGERPDHSRVRQEMSDVVRIAKALVPAEWEALSTIFNVHALAAVEEEEGFISWIHRTETTRLAFCCWQDQLLEATDSIPELPDVLRK